jgi:hypothetical protein
MVLVALFAGLLMPSQAQAVSIGILGGDVDPILPSITNTSFFDLSQDACFFLPSSFYCAAYEVPNSGRTPTDIFSIDFRMTKPNGNNYAATEIGLFTVDGASNLPSLSVSSLFPDGFTFTLFDPSFSSIVCGAVPNFCRADFFADSVDVSSVSIVGVNGVPSEVPEPASLLLCATGVAAIVARRRLARSKRQGL